MENKDNNLEIIETSDIVEEPQELKSNTFKNIVDSVCAFFKKFKSNKIKNEALLRRGGYSVVITALVLAGLIIVNVLTASLADRFNLTLDMTSDKKNSISEENLDYIKNLDADVNITVIATEEDYTSYMAYYAQNQYGVTISSQSETEYFDQTITLVSKYHDYNDKIAIKYVDPQSTEFTAISTTYSAYELYYGDMIITSNVAGKERIKVLRFEDIYVLSSSDSSSSYYQSYTLAASKLETALTSAIAYVTSTDSKKVAVLSGHSQNNYTDAYVELLTANNYDITNISDKLITNISNEYDAIIISAPSIDFIGSELDVIGNFLENDGKKGKGLIFFADATCPALPNFYSFLKQWGIEVNEGILFETDSNNHMPDEPTTMGIYPAEVEDDDITEKLNMAIANYIVPMNVCEDSSLQKTATALMQTTETVVAAPVGSSNTWADYTDNDKKQFDCVIQAVDSDFDSENNKITSYIMAFSSVEFVQSTWASYADLSNQDIVIACTDRAAHVGDTSMVFTSKVINNESFASAVTAGSTKIVLAIFVFIIPIVIIAAGIVVFIRRRNAR